MQGFSEKQRIREYQLYQADKQQLLPESGRTVTQTGIFVSQLRISAPKNVLQCADQKQKNARKRGVACGLSATETESQLL